MKVIQQGKDFGTATLTQTVGPDGAKVQESVIVAKGPGNDMTIRQVARYDRTGRPLTKSVTANVGERQMSAITATFDATGGTIRLVREAGNETKRFPLPKGMSMADPSEFWFIKSKPKPGTTVRAATLNLMGTGWEATQTTYIGKTQVQIGNKRVAGHRVRSEGKGRVVEVIVDDRGMPLTISDSRGLKMVRIGARG